MDRKMLRMNWLTLLVLGLILMRVNFASASPKVEIYNQESAQFEIVSETSPVIHIDVVDTTLLQNTFTDNAILAITHKHPDHYDKAIAESFPGKSLVVKSGQISFGSGKVISLPSAHLAGDKGAFLQNNASNYIILVELAGLKIAHFGDIGQNSITREQLDMLTDVDIIITQFMNPLSDMDMTNKKAFNLISQLSPKIVIPASHGRLNADVINHAKEIWDVYASEEISLTFAQETLPEKTTMIIWGDGVTFVTDEFAIPEWKVTN